MAMYSEPVVFGHVDPEHDDALAIILREPRPNGFDGRLRFDDLEKLFLMLHVQPSDEERDELWAEMIYLFNNGRPCAWIDDISLIVGALTRSGLWTKTVPASANGQTEKGDDPEGGGTTASVGTLRYQWPTVSSARRTATSLNRLCPVTVQPAKHAAMCPSAFERLSKPKEPLRANLTVQSDDSINECTFAPNVGRGKKRPSALVATYMDRDTASYRGKLKTADEGSETDDGVGESFSAPRSFRPPPPLPDSIPIGYVDAVARLRRSATVHERRFRGFPECLRGNEEVHMTSRRQPSTILRLPGETDAINIWLMPTV